VVAILRAARTPKGTEVRTVIKHVTKRLRQHWPNTRIVWRGDSHYGRVEAMEWAEDNGVDYIFGLAGNSTLDALVAETARSQADQRSLRSSPSSASRAAPRSPHARRRGLWGADRRASSQERFNQIRRKRSRGFHRVSQFVTLHRAACGRQVSWGIRQSIPDKRYESCAALIVTTPSVIDGHRKPPRSSRLVNKHAPWTSCQIIFIKSLQRVS
jgi:hypothetical protein